jgi:8-amino-7-oxononanoate synthase
MSRFDALFDAELRRREAAGLRRSLVPTAPLAPGQVQRQGQRLLNFSSNDYLDLARHPLLAQRAAEYAAAYGTGTGASRLVTGTQPVHAALEARVAAWKGRPAAMLLASGWQANVAVLGSLLRFFGPGTLLFTDELNHSSLVHGARVAGIKPLRYRHNDMAQLGAMLHEARALPHQRVIATESVFSMDGDRADIAALAALAEEHNAFLYVDEAHATGVLGPNGAGLCTAQSRVDLVMGTFSKAMGSFGAYVAGSQALIDFLINACAGFIYTTAPPPPVLGAIDAALDLMPHCDAARARLASSAQRVRRAFQAERIDTAASTTQIVPAIVGDAAAAVDLSTALRARGILAVAIRPPTVPAGTSRLRFALSAAHGDADIDELINAVRASLAASSLAA